MHQHKELKDNQFQRRMHQHKELKDNQFYRTMHQHKELKHNQFHRRMHQHKELKNNQFQKRMHQHKELKDNQFQRRMHQHKELKDNQFHSHPLLSTGLVWCFHRKMRSNKKLVFQSNLLRRKGAESIIAHIALMQKKTSTLCILTSERNILGL